MLESFINKNVLVVVAHPDDEILGLGASLHRLIHQYNCKIKCLILGEGITSRSNSRNVNIWQTEMEIHRSNIFNAQKVIGYHSIGIFDFPDNRFDTVALLDLIKIIEHEKKEFQSEIIFTHHGGDLNIDHQRTFEAVITACRPLPNETVKTIISFETPSSTEWRASTDPKHFIPNLFLEVSAENLEAKINAMECYDYEKRNYPHPRSPEALKIQAQRWGIIIGKQFAEAFNIVRDIN